MKRSFPYSTTAVAIAIGLIAVSTVILSSFIYFRWLGRENLVDETLKRNITRRIDQYRERIEQTIIDNDGWLFSM
ncbi:MAG: hypothetical protein H6Q05_3129, partial [Acidobacteria bacterium]|nr:hypothetical protein [Acidobacteriota bacterium]